MLLGGNYFIIVLTMKLLVLLTRLKIEIVGFQSVIVKRNNVAATEVLVQWQHHPKEDMQHGKTVTASKVDFHISNLVDKVGFWGRVIDSCWFTCIHVIGPLAREEWSKWQLSHLSIVIQLWGCVRLVC